MPWTPHLSKYSVQAASSLATLGTTHTTAGTPSQASFPGGRGLDSFVAATVQQLPHRSLGSMGQACQSGHAKGPVRLTCT